jgi:hypothetical protein
MRRPRPTLVHHFVLNFLLQLPSSACQQFRLFMKLDSCQRNRFLHGQLNGNRLIAMWNSNIMLCLACHLIHQIRNCVSCAYFAQNP